MIKAKEWDRTNLSGDWLFTYKVDGVRALVKGGIALSRSNKPLHGLKHLPDGDYEIFHKDWETSVSLVRTHSTEMIPVSAAYRLIPIDGRLKIMVVTDPTAAYIEKEMRRAVAYGYEGLVLRQGDVWLKVKPSETYDVRIKGFIEGKGKNSGKLGAFITDRGRVGTGFTDSDRSQYWGQQHDLEGAYIEVECMGLTPSGKFRHPRFKRMRWDK